MNSGIRVRAMTIEDLGQADSLRALAGWNQTLQDWRRFLTYEPGGCFVAEWDGQLAGTVTATCFGPVLGWVGMLLVHPEHRRHGVGSALLQRSLDHLHSRGVGCVKLDATPLGRPLYARFGFVAESALTRWEASTVARTGSTPPLQLENGSAADLAAIMDLDSAAFGVSREKLLKPLLTSAECLVVHRDVCQPLSGYGLLRSGSRAQYLGPVVARSRQIAADIIGFLLGKSAGELVFWDTLDENESAGELVASLGFQQQRHLLRMVRGRSLIRPDSALQYAIVDPAVG